RDLPDKYIIRGNEERYLENLIGKDQTTWTDGQMQISYWCYRNISTDCLSYLMSLPHTIDTVADGVGMHIAHASDAFTGSSEFDLFGPAVLAEEFSHRKITADILRAYISDKLQKDSTFRNKVSALEGGVYIFGHSHVQWTFSDGGVLLINPGSCGLPLDGIAESIPYTILTVGDGRASAEEIRLPFDKRTYTDMLRQTTQYTEAPVWSKVIIKELLTTREHLTFFLQAVNTYAEETGDKKRPFSVDTWEKAFEVWEKTLADKTDML
ncbi:MAG: metallophosphoesterase family protein, partial [Oscillospiraceae bacterium]|nr:metallophosphoesterase family protein [Oscillospiraceae bacterium]